MKKRDPMLLFFVALFILGAVYILFVETEKYESKAIVTIKDLSNKQSVAALGSVLLGQGDVKTKQDSELLTIYIASPEMYDYLDREFNLSAYYSSENLDPFQRLYPHSPLLPWRLDRENLLDHYSKDLETVYDDLSGTLQISFFHHNPLKAQEIVQHIIRRAGRALNSFDKTNATILARFLKMQEERYHKRYTESIKKIIAFQNRIGLIDPDINIQMKSELLAQLESELIKMEVEYQAKRVRLTPNSTELKVLQKQIAKIRQKIKSLRSTLAGGRGKKGLKLNQDKFAFEILKSELAFNRELYRQTLIKLEDAKISASQNAKNLIVVVPPVEAQQYARPDKVRSILSWMITLIFLFGIIRVGAALLREHKD
jgi:capsular polysaccharide transport system permease protein